MKAATLFPDDDIHDSAEDWKGRSGATAVPYHNGTLTSCAAAESDGFHSSCGILDSSSFGSLAMFASCDDTGSSGIDFD